MFIMVPFPPTIFDIVIYLYLGPNSSWFYGSCIFLYEPCKAWIVDDKTSLLVGWVSQRCNNLYNFLSFNHYTCIVESINCTNRHNCFSFITVRNHNSFQFNVKKERNIFLPIIKLVLTLLLSCSVCFPLSHGSSFY